MNYWITTGEGEGRKLWACGNTEQVRHPRFEDIVEYLLKSNHPEDFEVTFGNGKSYPLTHYRREEKDV